MERTAWTDERLDDLATGMREGFARMDQDLRDLRRELSSEVGGLRSEMTTQMEALRQTVLRVGGGMLLGFISVLAAILARGA